MQAGMQPVLCVGESLSARESDKTIEVVMAQCEAVWFTTELTGDLLSRMSLCGLSVPEKFQQ